MRVTLSADEKALICSSQCFADRLGVPKIYKRKTQQCGFETTCAWLVALRFACLVAVPWLMYVFPDAHALLQDAAVQKG